MKEIPVQHNFSDRFFNYPVVQDGLADLNLLFISQAINPNKNFLSQQKTSPGSKMSGSLVSLFHRKFLLTGESGGFK